MRRMVEGALGASLEACSPEIRSELVRQVVSLCEELISRERDRCVAECRRRAELWRTTSSAGSTIASVREEARARANEALYLADLLEQISVSSRA